MFVRYAAALMLAAEIAIHVYLAPDHLEEMPYIGMGFVVASVLCAVALVLVLLDRPAGWLLGTALCVGMAVLFVISRLVGLPDYHEEWTSDSSLGLWSLVPEALFVLLAWVRARRGSELVAVFA
ncbi:MAG TPA: hypothetical protein VFI19_14020 [Nocardioides sp.]|nr:hypothetical protein [Nocardioides sp.]